MAGIFTRGEVDKIIRNAELTDEQKTDFSTPSVEDIEGTDDFPFWGEKWNCTKS